MMLTYHNNPEIRDIYQKRMRDHLEADEVIQGTGYKNGKGCFVGCVLNDYNHSAFPREIGVPEELAHLADAIFEGLEKDEAKRFFQWWSTVAEGLDLTMVWPKFAHALLVDSEHGVIRHAEAEKFKRQRDATQGVADLYGRWIATGEKPSPDEFKAAREAAREAARGTALAAIAAAWAAWAARAAVRAAPREIHWRWCRDLFQRLVNEAPRGEK